MRILRIWLTEAVKESCSCVQSSVQNRHKIHRRWSAGLLLAVVGLMLPCHWSSVPSLRRVYANFNSVKCDSAWCENKNAYLRALATGTSKYLLGTWSQRGSCVKTAWQCLQLRPALEIIIVELWTRGKGEDWGVNPDPGHDEDLWGAHLTRNCNYSHLSISLSPGLKTLGLGRNVISLE